MTIERYEFSFPPTSTTSVNGDVSISSGLKQFSGETETCNHRFHRNMRQAVRQVYTYAVV